MQRLRNLSRRISRLIQPKSSAVDPASSDVRTVSELEPRTQESIIFENPSMLRATRAFHALQRFGVLFQDSAGSEATYALSEPVSAIDVFVSHNWSTGRSRKYLALALYLNLRDALLAALLGVTAAALLTVLGVLPTFAGHPEFQWVRVSIASRVTGSALFFFTLLLGHEVKGRLGYRGPRLFVDKAVIHQTNAELKREGIRRLAGFLAHTDCMVIVYAPETYFKRLWTVYELASMLVLRPNRRIVVIPASLPKLVLVANPLWLLCSLVYSIVRTEHVWGLLGLNTSHEGAHDFCMAIFLIPILPIVFEQRRLHQQCQQMWKSVKDFSIQSTECTCEEDRPVIYGNVAAFMRDFVLKEPGMNEAEALEAFNSLVRSQLPVALGSFTQHTAIPYKYVVLVFAVNLMSVFDSVVDGFLSGTVLFPCLAAVFDATVSLAMLPSMVIFCQWGMRDMRLVCCTLKLLFSLCIIFLQVYLLEKLFWWSLVSNGWLLAYLGTVAGWFAVAAFLYRPRAAVRCAPPAPTPTLLWRQKTAEHQAPE